MQDRGDPGRRGRRVAAEPRVHLGPEAGDLALFRAAQRHVLDVVPAVDRGLVVFRAVFRPLDRPSQVHRSEAHERLVGVGRDLAPEPAAHLRRDHADPVLGELGHYRQEKPVDVWVLARDPRRELPGAGVVARARGARLQGRREEPVLDDALLHRDRGLRERLRRVASRHLPGERDVARHLRVEHGGALLGRLLGIDHRVQGVVVHVDQIEGVSRRRPRLGHDQSDAIAHVPHLIGREQRMGRNLEIAVRHVPRARDRVELVLHVHAGVHGGDSRSLLRIPNIDLLELGVRVGATQNGRIEEAGELHVVGVRRPAGDEPRVFAPLDAGAEERCHAGLLLLPNARPPQPEPRR